MLSVCYTMCYSSCCCCCYCWQWWCWCVTYLLSSILHSPLIYSFVLLELNASQCLQTLSLDFLPFLIDIMQILHSKLYTSQCHINHINKCINSGSEVYFASRSLQYATHKTQNTHIHTHTMDIAHITPHITLFTTRHSGVYQSSQNQEPQVLMFGY